MSARLREAKVGHDGKELPAGIYSQLRPDGSVASYRVRWEERGPDGKPRQGTKSFSVRKHGTGGAALAAAYTYRQATVVAVRVGGGVEQVDPSARLTVEELFQEWCMKRGPELSDRYAYDAVHLWDTHVAVRALSKARLDRLSQEPVLITRFQDEIAADGVPASTRAQVLKVLRAVLRWGRRRHPNALTVELSGLFELPSQKRKRLAYAADAYGLERVIEAAESRDARDSLLPIRDGALIAAMGFTIAARPSEWLRSVSWSGVHERSVELQLQGEDSEPGLKTGARAALLLPSARERIEGYRAELERRFGPQPEHGLVFQALRRDGPLWSEGGRPVPWSADEYKRWTARVWRPARSVAAKAAGVPAGLRQMRFYDCRHTAISIALHSTLVISEHGMNLHNLAAWAGHDVSTLQRYYSHIIARYDGGDPIDLRAECAAARRQVAENPFNPPQDGAA